MRKTALSLVLLLIPALAFCELKIAFTYGDVSINKTDGSSIEAQAGSELEAGDRIKTETNSRVILVMDQKTRIWVKQDSEFEVTSTGNESYFNILAGKIRAKVKGLSGKKFRVSTPVSVASIRGTDFVLSYEGVLAVLEGRVDFSDPALLKMIEVGAGQVGSVSDTGDLNDARPMTSEEKSELKNEWGGFSKDREVTSKQENKGKQGDVNQDLKSQMAELRSELRQVIREAKIDAGMTREITNEMKDSDMSAGRTLRDIHGNVVRVEQHLMRPDNSTIQILNLTKRNNYTYSDKYGWGYNGSKGSRLDLMEVTIKMNMDLPEQLSEWPGYISSKSEDEIHPSSVLVRLSNQGDEITNTGVWRLKGQAGEKKGEVLDEDRLVFTATINGYKVDPDYDASKDAAAIYKDGTDANGSDTNDLWAWGISPQIKVDKTEIVNGASVTTTKYIRIASEGYGITNGGKILNIDDFTKSSTNPFTTLKQIAGEEVIFAREVQTTPFAQNKEFFRKGNIDLVTTPDLIIAVAEKLASQLGDISKSSSNDLK